MISIAAFTDKVIKNTETGKPFRLQAHQRAILDLAYELLVAGAWSTFIYSTIKKSGKTTIQAILLLWWAYTHDDDELKIAANDFDQGVGRVHKVMRGLAKHNPTLKCRILAGKIIFRNGSVADVIANDAPGEAGANQGASGWDELWGYTSEQSLRLWEELSPVPNKPSVRFISTYAGWTGESKLLEGLYLQGVDKEEHPEGQAERIHPTLPLYLNREAGLLCYWDHEPRMPWQTAAYYQTQRKNLRPGTYSRLHENKWTSSEGAFISAAQWDAIVDPSRSPLLTEGILFVGVDVGIKSDNAAVAAVGWDSTGTRIVVACHRKWVPTKLEPVTLGDVKNYIAGLSQRHQVVKVYADPYQAMQMIQELQAEGLPIEEFPQTVANTTIMGESLFSTIKDKNLIAYPSDEMKTHITNAVGVETPRGVRMAKGTASKKIDLAIALSMAIVAALKNPGASDLSEMLKLNANIPERETSDWNLYQSGAFSVRRGERFPF